MPQVAAATITQIQMFRDYIHYHLKCSSAFAFVTRRLSISQGGC